MLLGGCGSKSEVPDAESVVATFGNTGLSDGQFFCPRSAVVIADRIFVVDRTGRIQRFNCNDWQVEKVWRTPETKLGMPVGITASADGRLYVADTHYSRILIYDQQGQLLESFGEAGAEPGKLGLPTDIAIDQDGNLYISQMGGQVGSEDLISKFDSQHRFVTRFGGTGAGEATLSRPVGLTIDRQNTLWVADGTHHRLVRFSLDGQYLGQVGSKGSQPGQFRYPYDTALLPDGTLVVAEFEGCRLQQIAPDGRCLRVWGRAGQRVGEIGSPWGVAVAGDRVFAVDYMNNRVQVIEWQ